MPVEVCISSQLVVTGTVTHMLYGVPGMRETILWEGYMGKGVVTAFAMGTITCALCGLDSEL
jgi:hypothetical protein